MKKIFLAFCFVTAITYSQTPCVNGFAGPFPCDGYDLQSQIGLGTFGAAAGNDSWGWTDPLDGKEYAIVCLDNSTVFIDISSPASPIYLGNLPTETGSSIWRDVKVYNNFAFIVSDGNGAHGMQIFDLTRLRNVPNAPETFNTDALYTGFENAHNIVINEDKPYAYAVGSNTFSGGPHIVNIQNPLNPVFAGAYSPAGYTHDAQVITYSGMDASHIGKEIYLGSNVNEVVILDVTNPANVQFISSISYPDVSYTHQGWITEDQRFFIVGDEVDEISFGFNTRTLVFDISDLDNPQLHMDYFGPTSAIDHNGYVRGDKYYLANYTAGVRVIDISDLQNMNMVETGFFNTHPENDNVAFNGAWSLYPYFESGNIVVSDVNRGFILIKDPDFLSVEELSKDNFSIYPNPAQDHLTIKSVNTPVSSIIIYNTIGQEVLAFTGNNTLIRTLDISALAKGVYLVKVNGNTVKKLIKQ